MPIIRLPPRAALVSGLVLTCCTTPSSRPKALVLPRAEGRIRLERLDGVPPPPPSPSSAPSAAGCDGPKESVTFRFKPRIVAELAKRRTPLPKRWADVLGDWRGPTAVVGKCEICLLGGEAGQRPVKGGVCFDARANSWRAVAGDVVPFGLWRCKDCFSCRQEKFGRNALFKCTLHSPERTDHSGHAVPAKTSLRYYQIKGVR